MVERQRISACSGTFDGNLHPGHEYFLTQVAHSGDRSVVFVNTDDVIRRNKKREPIFSQEARAAQVADLGIVSEVILFQGNDEAQLQQIEKLLPGVYCFSEKNDYPFDLAVQRRLTPYGTLFVTVPVVQSSTFSTSQSTGVLLQRFREAVLTATALQEQGNREGADFMFSLATNFAGRVSPGIGSFNRSLPMRE